MVKNELKMKRWKERNNFPKKKKKVGKKGEVLFKPELDWTQRSNSFFLKDLFLFIPGSSFLWLWLSSLSFSFSLSPFLPFLPSFSHPHYIMWEKKWEDCTHFFLLVSSLLFSFESRRRRKKWWRRRWRRRRLELERRVEIVHLLFYSATNDFQMAISSEKWRKRKTRERREKNGERKKEMKREQRERQRR